MGAFGPSVGKSSCVLWSAASDVGKVRERNEDAYAVFSLPPPVGGELFMVADGLGGQQAGDVASSLALERLRAILPAWASQRDTAPGVDDIGTALTESMQRVNEELFRAAAEREEWYGMATTLTIVRVSGPLFQYAHVGDSRLYLYRKGRLTQLSQDHALVNELIRTGEITADQARRHPSRHVLTQAIGMDRRLDIDSGNGRLIDGDMLLLCTDGLLAVVNEDEMGQLLCQTPPMNVAQALVTIANERGSPDNVTVIAISYKHCDDSSEIDLEVDSQ